MPSAYKTARRQWERYDPENPAANLIDAKRVGADLAHEPRRAGAVMGDVSDFQPSVEAPIIHGTGGQLMPKPDRYYAEKIAELVMTQGQLAKAVAERDALAKELLEIKRVAQTYNQPDRRDTWKWLNEIGDVAVQALLRLESGELRKLTA